MLARRTSAVARRRGDPRTRGSPFRRARRPARARRRARRANAVGGAYARRRGERRRLRRELRGCCQRPSSGDRFACVSNRARAIAEVVGRAAWAARPAAFSVLASVVECLRSVIVVAPIRRAPRGDVDAAPPIAVRSIEYGALAMSESVDPAMSGTRADRLGARAPDVGTTAPFDRHGAFISSAAMAATGTTPPSAATPRRRGVARPRDA